MARTEAPHAHSPSSSGSRATSRGSFSTLNTSNPFGEVVGAILLVALAERRVLLRLTAASLGLASLGLSLVRAAWVALLVAVATLVRAGRIRVQALAAFVVIVVIGLVFFGGTAAQTVYTRFSTSVSWLSYATSGSSTPSSAPTRRLMPA